MDKNEQKHVSSDEGVVSNAADKGERLSDALRMNLHRRKAKKRDNNGKHKELHSTSSSGYTGNENSEG